MKKILGLITTSVLVSTTLMPCTMSAQAASPQTVAEISCKMRTQAWEEAEAKVAAAQTALHDAAINLERHHDATVLGGLLAAQAYINADVASYELYIAKKQNKATVALEERAKDLEKRHNTIMKNLPKLDKNEAKAQALFDAAAESLATTEAELAKLKSCAKQTPPRSDHPIPFPISRITVARAALEKAQANYDAVSESLRKSELSYNLAQYDKSVADVEYMLAESKSKIAIRQDLAKQADLVLHEAGSKAMMAGALDYFAIMYSETVHADAKRKSEIKAADAALKEATAMLTKRIQQLDKAKQLSDQAHEDLTAAFSIFTPAVNKLANAVLRWQIAEDQAYWDRTEKTAAEAALAKAQAAFDAAKKDTAK